MTTRLFRKGDIVRLVQLPINYMNVSNPTELRPLLDLELKIDSVSDGGQVYRLKLDKERQIGQQVVEVLPVHYTWVEAILTVEEIK